MALVDLNRDVVILKVLLAGPPEVGKSERLRQIGQVGAHEEFGGGPSIRTRMASFRLDCEKDGRPVEVEVYEWHGPERADIRAKGLFVGLDGLIYMADAREDRYVDSIRTFQFVREKAGKSKLARLSGLLVLGRMDDGLLRLHSFLDKLSGITWADSLERDLLDADAFIEALQVYGEVMLRRSL